VDWGKRYMSTSVTSADSTTSDSRCHHHPVAVITKPAPGVLAVGAPYTCHE